MSKFFHLNNFPQNRNWQTEKVFGHARGHQPIDGLKNNFDNQTLEYLSETIINHLADSLSLFKIGWDNQRNKFNDFSFITAPAYKAFEGFLFQIAKDLKLPSSGNPKFVGTYFDEEKIDKILSKLIKELEVKTKKEQKLTKDEKLHIGDMIKDMKRFLYHYRHAPAHYHGEPMTTVDKALQNIMSMYRIINETTKTLLEASLIQIRTDIF